MLYVESQARQLNKVTLIGLVGCWPRPVGAAGDLGFVLLTERDAARPAGRPSPGHPRRHPSPRHQRLRAGRHGLCRGPPRTPRREPWRERHRRLRLVHPARATAARRRRADQQPRIAARAPALRASAQGRHRHPARAPCLGAADHCPSAIGAHRTDLTTREALTWWPTLSVPHSTTSLPGSATFGRSRGGPVASVLGWRGSAGWTPTLQCA